MALLIAFLDQTKKREPYHQEIKEHTLLVRISWQLHQSDIIIGNIIADKQDLADFRELTSTSKHFQYTSYLKQYLWRTYHGMIDLIVTSIDE